jgi:hypothetical protein
MYLSSFLFQTTLSQEDFSKVMQVLKENFAEGAVLEPTAPGTVESEMKWGESRKSLERPSTVEGMFTDILLLKEEGKIVLKAITITKRATKSSSLTHKGSAPLIKWPIIGLHHEPFLSSLYCYKIHFNIFTSLCRNVLHVAALQHISS